MSLSLLTTVRDIYGRWQEALAIADSAGANVVSTAGSTLPIDVSNTKFPVQVTVTEVCAGDGALDCRLEASVDGINWATVDASASMDVDPTDLNTDVGILDATGFYAPYWRVVVFSDGTDTVDACAVMLSIAAREIMPVRVQ